MLNSVLTGSAGSAVAAELELVDFFEKKLSKNTVLAGDGFVDSIVVDIVVVSMARAADEAFRGWTFSLSKFETDLFLVLRSGASLGIPFDDVTIATVFVSSTLPCFLRPKSGAATGIEASMFFALKDGAAAGIRDCSISIGPRSAN